MSQRVRCLSTRRGLRPEIIAMTQTEGTIEQLRERIEHLERARVQGEEERRFLERVLAVSGGLLREPDASIESMLDALRESFGLTDVLIVRLSREGEHSAHSSSGERIDGLRWNDERALQDLFEGKMAVTEDLRSQPLWTRTSDEVGPPGASALQLPFFTDEAGSEVVVLVCTHDEVGRLGARDLGLLAKFKPFLSYAFESARLKLAHAEAASLRRDQVLLEALTRSSSRLEALLRSMHAAVMVVDERGKVVLSNEAFGTTFGLSRDAISAKDATGASLLKQAAAAFPDPEQFITDLERIISEGRSISDEKLRTSDGRVLLLDFIPVHTGGELGGHLWQFRDVTRERSREALNRSIVATALDGIITVDHRGSIIEFNPSAERIFGHRSEDVVGQTMGDIIVPPELREAHRQGFKRYLESEEPRILGQRLELTAIRADGTIFPIELTVNRIPDSQPPKFTGFIRDITDAKLREAELEKARDAAEEASRVKSDFLAIMSHEIRTPMNAILGMTELSLELAESGEQRSLLQSVQVNADSLLHVINDVLDLSKVEAGRLVLREEAFCVADVMESVTEALASRAFEKGLELSCTADPALAAPVEGDANRLRQILVNLLGNAVKFTDRGEVSVESRCEDRDDGYLDARFTVRDTGVGMAEENLEAIFDPFFQTDSSLSRDFGGTGLGLAISSSLVALMGGRIWAESSLGSGSTFHFEVPLKKSTQAFARRRASDARFERWQAWVLTPTDALAEGVTRTFDSVKVPTRRVDEAGLKGGLTGDAHLNHVIVADQRLGLDALERVGRLALDLEGHKNVRLCVLIPPGPIDPWRVEGPEITVFVTKPASRRKLCAVIAQEFGEDDNIVLGTPAQRALTSGRILLVEDNPANQQYACRVLEGAGYRVTVADDGEVGLQEACSAEFDLILTDLDMPNKDGIEMTREIIARLGERAPPILAFTAHVVSGFRERCQEVGMAGFVSKPAKPAQLLNAVGEHTLRAPTLLVVDDSADNRELTRRFLSDVRVALEVIDNGRGAVERVRRGGVGALLLDMNMPGLDGYDTARQIRALPEGRRLPILAMTSWVGPEEEARCLEAGCSAYIEKPLRREALVEAIERLFETATDEVEQPSAAAKVWVDPIIADLVPEYLEARANDVLALRNALGKGDLEAVRVLAHNLAGSGDAYGFSRLTELGRALENVVVTGDPDGASMWIDEIARYLGSVEWEAEAEA